MVWSGGGIPGGKQQHAGFDGGVGGGLYGGFKALSIPTLQSRNHTFASINLWESKASSGGKILLKQIVVVLSI